MRDHLVSSLKFSRARDVELAWLDGVVSMEDERRDTTSRSLLPSLPDDDGLLPGSNTPYVVYCLRFQFRQFP